MLANFLNEPELNNGNCRNVDRHTGALGQDFITPDSLSSKKKKKGRDFDDDVEEAQADSKLKKPRGRRSSTGKQVKKDVKEVIEDDNFTLGSHFLESEDDASVNDNQLSLPKTKGNSRILEAQPGTRQQFQEQIGPVTFNPGMSPGSVKVRVDFAKSEAKNDMWERFEQDRQRRENAEREGLLRAMALQSETLHKVMDVHAESAKCKMRSEGHEKIAAAFGAHSNPTEQQRSMFGLFVRAIQPDVVADSPPTKSARPQADIHLPRQADGNVATSSSCQLALQNGFSFL